MNTKLILTLAAALGALSLTAVGQDDGSQDAPPSGQDGPGTGRRPVPAIVRALDANHDGVIDADEITNAVAVLKALDKNGDGKLTRDEYMGKPPMRSSPDGAGGPPQDGAGGPPPQDGPPPPQ